MRGAFAPLTVANAFFGGNVDVTGLLCGCDITAAIDQCARAEGAEGRRDLFVIPRVVFNDDGLTLDDMSLKDMEKEAGVPLAVVSCNPSEFLPEIEALARHLAARA